MTEILVAAISTGVSSLGLILVAVLSASTRSHAKAAREQVENTHSTNLRDDLDEVSRKVDWLIDVYSKEHPRRTRLFWPARPKRKEPANHG